MSDVDYDNILADYADTCESLQTEIDSLSADLAEAEASLSLWKHAAHERGLGDPEEMAFQLDGDGEQITSLKAALAEAEREKSELRARIACRADTGDCVMDEAPEAPCNERNCRYVGIMTRAERAEANLAAARETLKQIGYASTEGQDYRTTMLWFQAIARAFLERTGGQT